MAPMPSAVAPRSSSHYVTPAGRMMSDAPTAYALALEFGLVTDPELRQSLADRLAVLVREGGYRIATGFVGTPLVTDALSAAGHIDAAERLLFQTECPSWLYPVTMGATTVWERWDSLLPDGSVNPGEMTSFNHYALGAVADWLHRVVAGLAPDAPGYARLRIAPRPLTRLDHAIGTTPHAVRRGIRRVGREGSDVVVRPRCPPNTTAVVDLPGRGSGRSRWARARTNGGCRRRTGIRARGPLPGLEASLADVIDDPRAYRALLDTLTAIDPAQAEAVRAETLWGENRTVGSALMFVPPPVKAQVDEALRAATS